MRDEGGCFTWSEEKARTNRRKHGVTFDEAKTVFGDYQAIIVPDVERHSLDEERSKIIGYSERGPGHERLLAVVFTYQGDAIRLISARRPDREERRLYEKGR